MTVAEPISSPIPAGNTRPAEGAVYPVVGLDVSALDPEFKAHAQRGIGRYVTELVRYFRGRQESGRPIMAPPSEAGDAGSGTLRVACFDHQSIRTAGTGGTKVAAAIVERAPILRTTLRQQCLYPFQLSHAEGILLSGQSANPVELLRKSSVGRLPLQAVHFPAHMDAPAWGLSRYALTVLDLIPLVCADLYRAHQLGVRFRFARWLELSSIRNASVVLCISQHTAHDVHRILGVPWERLVVTPLGVDLDKFAGSDPPDQSPLLPVLKRRLGFEHGIPKRPLVLYVGGIDPRKNIPFMLEVFSRVRRAWDEGAHGPPPMLILAGGIQREREYPALTTALHELGLNQDVVLPGFIPDGELRLLYRLSRVFFFPSLYEGFGLPPLEAMAAGVPVLSSNTSAMPEVLGDAALYCSPTDRDESARRLSELLCSEQIRARLTQAGIERSRLFTWERTGEATLGAYRQLLGFGGR